MKKVLAWFAAFLLIGAIASRAATDLNPIFNNVTINGLLVMNGQIGKFKSKGLPPTINACGTGSPTVDGTDNSMLLTMGTGTLTECTVNFNTAWTQAPHCVAFPANATAAATGTTVARLTADAQTITFTGSNLTSAAYQILCW